MKVHYTVIYVSNLAKQLQTRHTAKRVANCTHVNMDRAYGRDQQCFVCGRAPSLGFLYVCHQDNLPLSNNFQERVQESFDQASTKPTLRQELEEIGLSESVIFAAEQGEYTDAQLEKLKALKLELKRAIEDAEQGVRINGMAAKMAAFAKGPPNNDGALNSSSQKNPVCYPLCRRLDRKTGRISIRERKGSSHSFQALSYPREGLVLTRLRSHRPTATFRPATHVDLTIETASTPLSKLYSPTSSCPFNPLTLPLFLSSLPQSFAS
jgi:hypothetical protein